MELRGRVSRKARSFGASDAYPAPWLLSPPITSAYSPLPPPGAGGAALPSDTSPAPFATLAVASANEPGLLPSDIPLLLTGATGLQAGGIDTRLANYNNLPNGPYQLTTSIGYDLYAGSPVDRFCQMWQQLDCNASYGTYANPSGCRADLFPWVEITIGRVRTVSRSPRIYRSDQ